MSQHSCPVYLGDQLTLTLLLKLKHVTLTDTREQFFVKAGESIQPVVG